MKPVPAAVLICILTLVAARGAETAITIDSRAKGRIFDGIGALSAGASSRLLIDYPEPQRGEILDYLFKPNFGAALQINKVEIGGDMNSTDGSEPSHMRTRDDENYHRGYEWWLMEESKKRNPEIKLFGLEWGTPNWINPQKNDVWTPANIIFIMNWVRHARSDHHLAIDYLGGWNERGLNKEWYEQFRDELNKAGMEKIRVVADDSFKWNVGHVAAGDPKFAASFEIIGMHYPGLHSSTNSAWKESFATGKPLWGSEIGSQPYDTGAGELAKLYNQGYIDSKMTAFINWSTIWSVLPGWPYSGDGLMLADQPWSGHYVVGLSIWATAHTTQFAQPGWHYLDGACGYLANNSKNGSFVALGSPDGRDFSLIIETVDAKAPLSLTFKVKDPHFDGPLHLWRTKLRSKNEEDWFVKQDDVAQKKAGFSLALDPGCLYSVTTTSGQAKGMTTPPPSAPLALPYRDDFQSYEIGGTPRFFSDQHGTFEIATAANGSERKCLRQVVTAKPVVWNSDADPGTIIGDPTWKDYSVLSDVLLEQPGYVDLIGRVMKTNGQNRINGYHLRLTDNGHWGLFVRTCNEKDTHDKKVTETKLAAGELSPAAGTGKWHRLTMRFSGNRITASIDGLVVANGITDETYASGFAGYQVSRWQNACFKNFEVTPENNENNPSPSRMH